MAEVVKGCINCNHRQSYTYNKNGTEHYEAYCDLNLRDQWEQNGTNCNQYIQWVSKRKEDDKKPKIKTHRKEDHQVVYKVTLGY